MAKTPDKDEAPKEASSDEDTAVLEQRQQDPLPEEEDKGEGRFPGDPNTYPDPENLPHAY